VFGAFKVMVVGNKRFRGKEAARLCDSEL